MPRKLTTHVHVTDEDSNRHVFGPDDRVPAWARRAITNPDVWEGEDDEDPSPPPRGGAGSGADAWRTYASAVGVDVPEDADRETVIAALEAGGVRTE